MSAKHCKYIDIKTRMSSTLLAKIIQGVISRTLYLTRNINFPVIYITGNIHDSFYCVG